MQWLDTVQLTALWRRQQREWLRRAKAVFPDSDGSGEDVEESAELAEIAAEATECIPRLAIAVTNETVDSPLTLLAEPRTENHHDVGLLIFVRTMTGDTIPLEMGVDAKVSDVLLQLCSFIMAPPSAQVLHFQGEALQPTSTLADAGVGQESCVDVIVQREKANWRDLMFSAWSQVTLADLRQRIGLSAKHLFQEENEFVMKEDFGRSDTDGLNYVFIHRGGKAVPRDQESTTRVTAMLGEAVEDGTSFADFALQPTACFPKLAYGTNPNGVHEASVESVTALCHPSPLIEKLCYDVGGDIRPSRKENERGSPFLLTVRLRPVRTGEPLSGEDECGDVLPVSKVPISLARRRARDFMTPLHVAASKGELREVNRMLDEAGESAKLLINSWDCRGRTPLQLALEKGSSSVALVLLDRGADAAPLLLKPMLCHTGGLLRTRQGRLSPPVGARGQHCALMERLVDAAGETLRELSRELPLSKKAAKLLPRSWASPGQLSGAVALAAMHLPDGSDSLLKFCEGAAAVVDVAGLRYRRRGYRYVDGPARLPILKALLLRGKASTAQELLRQVAPELHWLTVSLLAVWASVDCETDVAKATLGSLAEYLRTPPTLQYCHRSRQPIVRAAHAAAFALAKRDKWVRRMRSGREHLDSLSCRLRENLRTLHELGAWFGLAATPAYVPGFFAETESMLATPSDPLEWADKGEDLVAASPMYYVCCDGNPDTVCLMVECGVDPNAVCLMDRESLHNVYMCERPLAVSVERGRADVTTELLRLGADPCISLRIFQQPLSRCLLPYEHHGTLNLSAPRPTAEILNDRAWIHVLSFCRRKQDVLDALRLTCRANCLRFSRNQFWELVGPVPQALAFTLQSLNVEPERICRMQTTRPECMKFAELPIRRVEVDECNRSSVQQVLRQTEMDESLVRKAARVLARNGINNAKALAQADDAVLVSLLESEGADGGALETLSERARMIVDQGYVDEVVPEEERDIEELTALAVHISADVQVCRTQVAPIGCARRVVDVSDPAREMPGYVRYEAGFACLGRESVSSGSVQQHWVRTEGIRDSILAILPILEQRRNAAPLLFTECCPCPYVKANVYGHQAQYPLVWALRNGFTDLASRLLRLAESTEVGDGNVFVGLVGNMQVMRCLSSPYGLPPQPPIAGDVEHRVAGVSAVVAESFGSRTPLRWIKQGRSYCMPAAVRPTEEQVIVGDSVPQAILSLPPGAVRLELWRQAQKSFRAALGSVLGPVGGAMRRGFGCLPSADVDDPVTVTKVCAYSGAAAELRLWLEDPSEQHVVRHNPLQSFRTLLHAVGSRSEETYCVLAEHAHLRDDGIKAALAHRAVSDWDAPSESLALRLLSELEDSVAEVGGDLPGALTKVLEEVSHRVVVLPKERYHVEPDFDAVAVYRDPDEAVRRFLDLEPRHARHLKKGDERPCVNWGFRNEETQSLVATAVHAGKPQCLRWMLEKLGADRCDTLHRQVGWWQRQTDVSPTTANPHTPTLTQLALGFMRREVASILLAGAAPDDQPTAPEGALSTHLFDTVYTVGDEAAKMAKLIMGEQHATSWRERELPGPDWSAKKRLVRVVTGDSDCEVLAMRGSTKDRAYPYHTVTVGCALGRESHPCASEAPAVVRADEQLDYEEDEEDESIIPTLPGDVAAEVARGWGLTKWWSSLSHGLPRPVTLSSLCPIQPPPSWDQQPLLHRLIQPPLRDLRLPRHSELRKHFRPDKDPAAIIFIASDDVFEIPVAVAVPGAKNAADPSQWELIDTSAFEVSVGHNRPSKRLRCSMVVVDGDEDSLHVPHTMRVHYPPTDECWYDEDEDFDADLEWQREKTFLVMAERHAVCGDAHFHRPVGRGRVLGPVSLYLPDFRASSCDFKFVDAGEEDCTAELEGYFCTAKTTVVPRYKKWKGRSKGKEYYIQQFREECLQLSEERWEDAADVLCRRDEDPKIAPFAPEDSFYVLAIRLPIPKNTTDFLRDPVLDHAEHIYGAPRAAA